MLAIILAVLLAGVSLYYAGDAFKTKENEISKNKHIKEVIPSWKNRI